MLTRSTIQIPDHPGFTDERHREETDDKSISPDFPFIMLPISESGLPQGRRQHRRQNSTPTAAQTHRASPYPSIQQRRSAGHRRGISLDSRQAPTTLSATRQKYAANSNTNHHAGLAAIPQHHVLREAQQHSQQARPGPATRQANYTTSTNLPHSLGDHLGESLAAYSSDSNSRIPASQSMNPAAFMDASAMFQAWNDNAAAMAHNARVPYGHAMMPTSGYELFDQQSPLTTPTFFNFPDTPDADNSSSHSRKSSRRISNGIADQVSKFENMAGEPGFRAATPPFQTYNCK